MAGVKVRTTFRPDEEIEVNQDEADALKARGLLASGKTVEYTGAGVKAGSDEQAGTVDVSAGKQG